MGMAPRNSYYKLRDVLVTSINEGLYTHITASVNQTEIFKIPLVNVDAVYDTFDNRGLLDEQVMLSISNTFTYKNYRDDTVVLVFSRST